MKVLIFSDIHGNLPAFEKMLANETEVDQYLFLGDVVNYGPWDNECVDLLMDLDPLVCLMGNHEEYYISGELEAKHPLVKEFFNFLYPSFQRKKIIVGFENDYQIGSYTAIHTLNNEYIFPDSYPEIDKNYFIGHSHHQFHHEFQGFHLYNAGSVGQNRKFINVINYLVFDTESSEVEMKSLTYDLDLLINEMKSRSYPKICIEYYLNKEKIQ